MKVSELIVLEYFSDEFQSRGVTFQISKKGTRADFIIQMTKTNDPGPMHKGKLPALELAVQNFEH